MPLQAFSVILMCAEVYKGRHVGVLTIALLITSQTEKNPNIYQKNHSISYDRI